MHNYQIGDTVKIRDNGYSYTGAVDAAIQLGATNYCFNSAQNGKTYKVKGLGKPLIRGGNWSHTILLTDGREDYLIGKEGIKMIEKGAKNGNRPASTGRRSVSEQTRCGGDNIAARGRHGVECVCDQHVPRLRNRFAGLWRSYHQIKI